MAKMIHAMIRVLDETRSLAFYDTAFGLKPVDWLAFPDFTLIYLANDETGFELELTVNKGRTEPYDLGDGYGHIAVSTGDLEALHAKLEAAGYAPRPIKTLTPPGATAPAAKFFFIADPDGYQIEVLQRVGRYA